MIVKSLTGPDVNGLVPVLKRRIVLAHPHPGRVFGFSLLPFSAPKLVHWFRDADLHFTPEV